MRDLTREKSRRSPGEVPEESRRSHNTVTRAHGTLKTHAQCADTEQLLVQLFAKTVWTQRFTMNLIFNSCLPSSLKSHFSRRSSCISQSAFTASQDFSPSSRVDGEWYTTLRMNSCLNHQNVICGMLQAPMRIGQAKGSVAHKSVPSQTH